MSKKEKVVKKNTKKPLTAQKQAQEQEREQEANLPQEVTKPVDISVFAQDLVERGLEVELRECFQAAADVVEYIRAVHNKSLVLGSRYVPGTVKAVGESAVKGDLDSAKLLFDFLGFRAKQSSPTVATQINVGVPLLKDVIEIKSIVEGEVVDENGDDGEEV